MKDKKITLRNHESKDERRLVLGVGKKQSTIFFSSVESKNSFLRDMETTHPELKGMIKKPDSLGKIK